MAAEDTPAIGVASGGELARWYRWGSASPSPRPLGPRSPMQPEDTSKREEWFLHPTVVDESKDPRPPGSAPRDMGHGDDPLRQPLPDRLGRFRVVGLLGQGAMGRVLEAHDSTLDRRVAVKELHRDAGAGHRQRMLREAQALARLSHPNVVQIYDADEQDGRLFIAMELVEGQTLWSWAETPHPWTECVRVYVEAARGLAAAHAEGIVHRDFKPANCIIDARGRVKVLDFGLARGVDDEPDETELADRVRTLGVAVDPITVIQPGHTRVDSQLDSHPNSHPDEDPAHPEPSSPDAGAPPADSGVPSRAGTEPSGALSLRLTQTGATLGTPAYMAPEQAAGLPPDARSDQFSLCVALFEAIYGERPYAGSPGFALLADRQAPLETPRVRPGLPAVPGWLRKVLARGLSPDKGDRFVTVEALLEAIEHGRRRRRRIGLGLGGIGLAAALGLWATRSEPSPCEGLRHGGLPTWNSEARAAVESALSSGGGEQGRELWGATARELDRYADEWADARARACEATHVERVASAELLERRTACLDTRSLRVQATVEQLAEADASVAARAARAVRSLPPARSCLDAERLQGPSALPTELADEAEHVRRLIARSWALDATGRAAEGLPAADEAVTRTEALGKPATALRAEALHNRGRLYRAVGHLHDARTDLEAVVQLAERVDDETLAIDALRELLGVSIDEADRSVSDAWMTVVRGKLLRLADEDPRREAELHLLEGRLALQDERFDAAVESLSAALAGLDETGDGGLSRAQVLLRLAMAHGGREHDEQALLAFDRAHDLAEREGLLTVRAEVLHELGRFHDERGRPEPAEEALRRSLALRVGFDGPTAPVTISTRTLLARLLAQRGELDEAYAVADAARRSLGPGVPAIRRAQVLTLLASFERSRGEWEAALASYRRAREAWSTLSAPDEIELAMLDASMADCLMMQGDHAAARTRYESALRTLEVRVPKDDPRRVYPLFGLAHLLYERGDRADAVGLYRRALAIQTHGLGEHPELSALLRWELGRAVLEWAEAEAGERAEAQGLLAAAREYFEGIDDAAMVAEIDAFVERCGSWCPNSAAPQSPPEQEDEQR